MLLWPSPTSYQQQCVTGCISETTADEEKQNDKTFTSFIRLCRGCLFIFQYFSIHQPCFHIGKTGYETLVPVQELYTAKELMDKQLSSICICRVCICAQMRSSKERSQWYKDRERLRSCFVTSPRGKGAL